eukprot:c12171_g1_i1.p1 GENE.c12171_g1_i1~~c12171_g1_i1.p1  ORF type:complete len:205 (+),score=45.26 c12171_g1_i1:68-682(+)
MFPSVRFPHFQSQQTRLFHKPPSKQHQHQQASTTTIATCAEMNDVWLHVIGPELGAADIISLSMVNRWGRVIAHSILHHQGFAVLPSNPYLWDMAFSRWANLSFSLELLTWQQQEQPDIAQMLMRRQLGSLRLWRCCVVSFAFVDPLKLKELVVCGVQNLNEPSTQLSLASLLRSCLRLTSLDLSPSLHIYCSFVASACMYVCM